MRIHILGICGTFMGGVAALACQQGHAVSGQDANVYPPMSTQLQQLGIDLIEGYDDVYLREHPVDIVIIGNALSRGNAAVEWVLNHKIPYISGAQWLSEHILKDKWVLAVAGTHGKTTTASLLTWILEYAGLNPGFLIGGVPQNFGLSSRLTESVFFVVEADEYDTAFFDKRSKFVHYHPDCAILNNLEFDHADIFADLDAIETQFHHLIRTIPARGLILYPQHGYPAIERVLRRGCWSARQSFAVHDDLTRDNPAQWQAKLLPDSDGISDGRMFELIHQVDNSASANQKAANRQTQSYRVQWPLLGAHNVHNALGAIAAAHHAGVSVAIACEALSRFKNVKRRLELRADSNGVKIYDDFAHHPTAIALTIAALRSRIGDAPLLAVVEPRSNSMKMGVFNAQLPSAMQAADQVFFFVPPGAEHFEGVLDGPVDHIEAFTDHKLLQQAIIRHIRQLTPPVHVLVMSNGSFNGLIDHLIYNLST